MVEFNQNTNFQIEQDLLNCGLTAESINSIRDTAVITRNGTQHVVPEMQSHLDESGRQPSTQINQTPADQTIANRLQEQQQMFTRYKQFSENRIATLERNLSSTMEQLKQLHTAVTTIKSNQQAQQREANLSSPQEETQATNNQQKAPENKPVDRNGVSPVDVKVESIFYCGEN